MVLNWGQLLIVMAGGVGEDYCHLVGQSPGPAKHFITDMIPHTIKNFPVQNVNYTFEKLCPKSTHTYTHTHTHTQNLKVLLEYEGEKYELLTFVGMLFSLTSKPSLQENKPPFITTTA